VVALRRESGSKEKSGGAGTREGDERRQGQRGWWFHRVNVGSPRGRAQEGGRNRTRERGNYTLKEGKGEDTHLEEQKEAVVGVSVDARVIAALGVQGR
jgi:hypothetical protein